MGIKYIDYDLIEKCPNKYNLKPSDIKRLKVKDWERLQKICWFNEAMDEPCWCHLEGCNLKGKYDDSDEFWIGFYLNGKVDYSFSCWEGMCSYNFKHFYDVMEIENRYDMGVQINAMRFLNMIIDQGIVERGKNGHIKTQP